MNKYVIGVDGGGTKTQCALFDTHGSKVDYINWGPLNHEVLKGGFEELRLEINLLIGTILRNNNINAENIIKGVFGIAGVDTKEQQAIVSEMIYSTGIKDIILVNDAFLGVKAGSQDGYGICVINGTGCAVAGINSSGEMLQIGGQGGLTGDKGGGGELGRAAISSVYNHLFKLGKYTIIKELLFNDLGIISKYDYMDVVTAKLNDGTLNISDVNKYVFTAANIDDEVACSILEEAGREYGYSVNGIIVELEFHKQSCIEIILAGSVNVKGNSPILIEALKKTVLDRNPGLSIKFVILEKPPVVGAIIWAFEGYSRKDIFFNKVSSQF